MRETLFAAALALGSLGSAAQAQVLDRYGSQSTYAPPPVAASPTAGRVLTWAGKTTPQTPSPQGQYAPAPYAPPGQAPQRQPAAYPSIQGGAYGQAPAAAPQPYPAQPQPGAPQPLARPAPPQGPPVTVAPQAFYPPQVLFYPQAYQGLNGQPPSFAPVAPPVQAQFPPAPAQGPQAAPQGLPSSIYDPPRPAAAAEAAQPIQLAMGAPTARGAEPGQGARTYSIHRPFGRTPDPAPSPAPGLDSGALLLPAEDNPETAKGEGLGLRSLADLKD